MNLCKSFKTVISVFTALTFIVTSLGISPNAFAAATMPEVSLPYQVKLTENLRVSIPQEFGKLEHFKMGQGPAIFHIQDAHGHYEGQQKIRRLLGFLNKTYGINTVLVEGSAFQLDAEKINFFPKDKKKTLAINEEFTRRAWVSGTELFLLDRLQTKSKNLKQVLGLQSPVSSLQSSEGAEAFGIENAEAYRANGRSFVNVLTEKQKTEQFLADMNMQIERLASHYLNQNLRDFLRRVESFEKNQIPLDTWLANLKAEAQKRLEIDLASPAQQLDWPMLVRLFKVQELVSKLDKQKFPKERDEFLKAIRRFLPSKTTGQRPETRDQNKVSSLQSPVSSQIEALLRSDSMSQQLPDPETSLLFEDMVTRLPENFNYEKFQNVRYYIGTLLLQSELKAELLMPEIQRLTDTLAAKLARNKEEQTLVALLADHRLLQKLFALELTPGDYEIIGRRMTDDGGSLKPSQLVKRFDGAIFHPPSSIQRVKVVQFPHISDLDQLYESALKFYAGAKDRDGVMIRRVEERLKETGATKVAVITGGFHSEPFHQYFAGKNYTYALISPKLSGSDETGRADYIKAVLASILPAKDTYKNPYVFSTLNPAGDGASLMGIKTSVIDALLGLVAGGVLSRAEARAVTHKLAGKTAGMPETPAKWLGGEQSPKDAMRAARAVEAAQREQAGIAKNGLVELVGGEQSDADAAQALKDIEAAKAAQHELLQQSPAQRVTAGEFAAGDDDPDAGDHDEFSNDWWMHSLGSWAIGFVSSGVIAGLASTGVQIFRSEARFGNLPLEMQRREFLKRIGLAGAAGLTASLVPQSIFGSELSRKSVRATNRTVPDSQYISSSQASCELKALQRAGIAPNSFRVPLAIKSAVAAMPIVRPASVPSQATKVRVLPGDRRLLVSERKLDGTVSAEYAFTMKGINWSPASVDTNPAQDPVGFRNEIFKWYQSDIPLMAKAGINTVRVYHDFGTSAEAFKVLDMFYQYGIKVIMTVDSPFHGGVADLENIMTIVNAYKNHPAILMWAIGNEWDINHYYGKYQTLEESAAFTEQAANVIHALDQNHPVTTQIADPHIPNVHPLSQEAFPNLAGPYTKDIVDTLCPSVDVWGLQIYRNRSFGDLFRQWASITAKPMFIGEFGADSMDHSSLPIVENEDMQADMDAGLWDETFFDLSAERPEGAAIGVIAFEFQDEWWKSGSPGIQTISFEPNYGQPDSGDPKRPGVNDEEYFGKWKITREPKKAALKIAERFTGSQPAVALSANPLLEITSQDPYYGATLGSMVTVKINGKRIFSRGGGGSGGRGINAFVLNMTTGIRIIDFKNFDTYSNGNKHADLVNYLNGLPDGAIVLIAIADEGGFWRDAWNNGGWPEPLAEQTKTLLSSPAWGSTQISNIRYRTGWAMIAKKGFGILGASGEGISSGELVPVTVTAQPSLTLDPNAGRRTPYAPLPQPAVTRGKKTAVGFEFDFESENGVVYRVEYTDNLKSGNWQLAQRGGSLIAEGTKTTWFDDGSFTGGNVQDVSNRFYRVVAIDRVNRSEVRGLTARETANVERGTEVVQAGVTRDALSTAKGRSRSEVRLMFVGFGLVHNQLSVAYRALEEAAIASEPAGSRLLLAIREASTDEHSSHMNFTPNTDAFDELITGRIIDGPGYVQRDRKIGEFTLGQFLADWILDNGTLKTEGLLGFHSEARLPAKALVAGAVKVSPYFIGMSMGGTKLHAALYINEGGTLRLIDEAGAKWDTAFPGKDISDPEQVAPDAILDVAVSLIGRLLKSEKLEKPLTGKDLNNIGITAPGPIDHEKGVIGAGWKLFNMPFQNYPWTEKLKEKFPGLAFAEAGHDSWTGYQGELKMGRLKGARHGYYVIQGSGLGGNGEDIPVEFTEVGHHIVRGADGHYRAILNGSERHPYESVAHPDPKKPYQLTSLGLLALMGELRIDEADVIHRDEKDLEDSVAKGAILALLVDKESLVRQFGGNIVMYRDVNSPEDITTLAAYPRGTQEAKSGRAIVRHIGEEVGRALACLLDVSYGKPWQIDRIVIGSGIGENLGIVRTGEKTRVLTNREGKDYYLEAIRGEAYRELTLHFKRPVKYSEKVSEQIFRSDITQDVRETAGFDRSVRAETRVLDSAGQGAIAMPVGLPVSLSKSLIVDMIGTEVKAMLQRYPSLRINHGVNVSEITSASQITAAKLDEWLPGLEAGELVTITGPNDRAEIVLQRSARSEVRAPQGVHGANQPNLRGWVGRDAEADFMGQFRILKDELVREQGARSTARNSIVLENQVGEEPSQSVQTRYFIRATPNGMEFNHYYDIYDAKQKGMSVNLRADSVTVTWKDDFAGQDGKSFTLKYQGPLGLVGFAKDLNDEDAEGELFAMVSPEFVKAYNAQVRKVEKEGIAVGPFLRFVAADDAKALKALTRISSSRSEARGIQTIDYRPETTDPKPALSLQSPVSGLQSDFGRSEARAQVNVGLNKKVPLFEDVQVTVLGKSPHARPSEANPQYRIELKPDRNSWDLWATSSLVEIGPKASYPGVFDHRRSGESFELSRAGTLDGVIVTFEVLPENVFRFTVFPKSSTATQSRSENRNEAGFKRIAQRTALFAAASAVIGLSGCVAYRPVAPTPVFRPLPNNPMHGTTYQRPVVPPHVHVPTPMNIQPLRPPRPVVPSVPPSPPKPSKPGRSEIREALKTTGEAPHARTSFVSMPEDRIVRDVALGVDDMPAPMVRGKRPAAASLDEFYAWAERQGSGALAGIQMVVIAPEEGPAVEIRGAELVLRSAEGVFFNGTEGSNVPELIREVDRIVLNRTETGYAFGVTRKDGTGFMITGEDGRIIVETLEAPEVTEINAMFGSGAGEARSEARDSDKPDVVKIFPPYVPPAKYVPWSGLHANILDYIWKTLTEPVYKELKAAGKKDDVVVVRIWGMGPDRVARRISAEGLTSEHIEWIPNVSSNVPGFGTQMDIADFLEGTNRGGWLTGWRSGESGKHFTNHFKDSYRVRIYRDPLHPLNHGVAMSGGQPAFPVVSAMIEVLPEGKTREFLNKPWSVGDVIAADLEVEKALSALSGEQQVRAAQIWRQIVGAQHAPGLPFNNFGEPRKVGAQGLSYLRGRIAELKAPLLNAKGFSKFRFWVLPMMAMGAALFVFIAVHYGAPQVRSSQMPRTGIDLFAFLPGVQLFIEKYMTAILGVMMAGVFALPLAEALRDLRYANRELRDYDEIERILAGRLTREGEAQRSEVRAPQGVHGANQPNLRGWVGSESRSEARTDFAAAVASRSESRHQGLELEGSPLMAVGRSKTSSFPLTKAFLASLGVAGIVFLAGWAHIAHLRNPLQGNSLLVAFFASVVIVPLGMLVMGLFLDVAVDNFRTWRAARLSSRLKGRFVELSASPQAEDRTRSEIRSAGESFPSWTYFYAYLDWAGDGALTDIRTLKMEQDSDSAAVVIAGDRLTLRVPGGMDLEGFDLGASVEFEGVLNIYYDRATHTFIVNYAEGEEWVTFTEAQGKLDFRHGAEGLDSQEVRAEVRSELRNADLQVSDEILGKVVGVLMGRDVLAAYLLDLIGKDARKFGNIIQGRARAVAPGKVRISMIGRSLDMTGDKFLAFLKEIRNRNPGALIDFMHKYTGMFRKDSLIDQHFQEIAAAVNHVIENRLLVAADVSRLLWSERYKEGVSEADILWRLGNLTNPSLHRYAAQEKTRELYALLGRIEEERLRSLSAARAEVRLDRTVATAAKAVRRIIVKLNGEKSAKSLVRIVDPKLITDDMTLREAGLTDPSDLIALPLILEKQVLRMDGRYQRPLQDLQWQFTTTVAQATNDLAAALAKARLARSEIRTVVEDGQAEEAAAVTYAMHRYDELKTPRAEVRLSGRLGIVALVAAGVIASVFVFRENAKENELRQHFEQSLRDTVPVSVRLRPDQRDPEISRDGFMTIFVNQPESLQLDPSSKIYVYVIPQGPGPVEIIASFGNGAVVTDKPAGGQAIINVPEGEGKLAKISIRGGLIKDLKAVTSKKVSRRSEARVEELVDALVKEVEEVIPGLSLEDARQLARSIDAALEEPLSPSHHLLSGGADRDYLEEGLRRAKTPLEVAEFVAKEMRSGFKMPDVTIVDQGRRTASIIHELLKELSGRSEARKGESVRKQLKMFGLLLDLWKLFRGEAGLFTGVDRIINDFADVRKKMSAADALAQVRKLQAENIFLEDANKIVRDMEALLAVSRGRAEVRGEPPTVEDLRAWQIVQREARTETGEAGSYSDTNKIKLTVVTDKEAMSQKALAMVLEDYREAIARKGHYVLGLATGSSPVRLYALLVEAAEQGLIDFSKVYTFNMDEYEGLAPEYVGNMSPQSPGDQDISYKAFMYQKLFGLLLKKGLVTQEWIDTHVHIFDSNPADAEAMCAAYEAEIARLGGADTWIGGIGSDGHIAFNEPKGYRIKDGKRVPVDSKTTSDSVSRRVYVTQPTADDNASFFEFNDRDPKKGTKWVRPDGTKLVFVAPGTAGAREITHDEALAMVPQTAFSIGVKTFKNARHKIVLVSVENKAEALHKGMDGKPDNDNALSLLQDDSNTDVIADISAAARLEKLKETRGLKEDEAEEIIGELMRGRREMGGLERQMQSSAQLPNATERAEKLSRLDRQFDYLDQQRRGLEAQVEGRRAGRSEVRADAAEILRGVKVHHANGVTALVPDGKTAGALEPISATSPEDLLAGLLAWQEAGVIPLIPAVIFAGPGQAVQFPDGTEVTPAEGHILVALRNGTNHFQFEWNYFYSIQQALKRIALLAQKEDGSSGNGLKIGAMPIVPAPVPDSSSAKQKLRMQGPVGQDLPDLRGGLVSLGGAEVVTEAPLQLGEVGELVPGLLEAGMNFSAIGFIRSMKELEAPAKIAWVPTVSNTSGATALLKNLAPKFFGGNPDDPFDVVKADYDGERVGERHSGTIIFLMPHARSESRMSEDDGEMSRADQVRVTLRRAKEIVQKIARFNFRRDFVPTISRLMPFLKSTFISAMRNGGAPFYAAFLAMFAMLYVPVALPVRILSIGVIAAAGMTLSALRMEKPDAVVGEEADLGVFPPEVVQSSVASGSTAMARKITLAVPADITPDVILPEFILGKSPESGTGTFGIGIETRAGESLYFTAPVSNLGEELILAGFKDGLRGIRSITLEPSGRAETRSVEQMIAEIEARTEEIRDAMRLRAESTGLAESASLADEQARRLDIRGRFETGLTELEKIANQLIQLESAEHHVEDVEDIHRANAPQIRLLNEQALGIYGRLMSLRSESRTEGAAEVQEAVQELKLDETMPHSIKAILALLTGGGMFIGFVVAGFSLLKDSKQEGWLIYPLLLGGIAAVAGSVIFGFQLFTTGHLPGNEAARTVKIDLSEYSLPVLRGKVFREKEKVGEQVERGPANHVPEKDLELLRERLRALEAGHIKLDALVDNASKLERKSRAEGEAKFLAIREEAEALFSELMGIDPASVMTADDRAVHREEKAQQLTAAMVPVTAAEMGDVQRKRMGGNLEMSVRGLSKIRAEKMYRVDLEDQKTAYEKSHPTGTQPFSPKPFRGQLDVSIVLAPGKTVKNSFEVGDQGAISSGIGEWVWGEIKKDGEALEQALKFGYQFGPRAETSIEVKIQREKTDNRSEIRSAITPESQSYSFAEKPSKAPEKVSLKGSSRAEMRNFESLIEKHLSSLDNTQDPGLKVFWDVVWAEMNRSEGMSPQDPSRTLQDYVAQANNASEVGDGAEAIEEISALLKKALDSQKNLAVQEKARRFKKIFYVGTVAALILANFVFSWVASVRFSLTVLSSGVLWFLLAFLISGNRYMRKGLSPEEIERYNSLILTAFERARQEMFPAVLEESAVREGSSVVLEAQVEQSRPDVVRRVEKGDVESDLAQIPEPLRTNVREFLTLGEADADGLAGSKSLFMQCAKGSLFRFDLNARTISDGSERWVEISVTDVTPEAQQEDVGFYKFRMGLSVGGKVAAVAKYDMDTERQQEHDPAIRVLPDYEGRHIGSILLALGKYLAKKYGNEIFVINDITAKGFYGSEKHAGFKLSTDETEGVFDLVATPLPPLPVLQPQDPVRVKLNREIYHWKFRYAMIAGATNREYGFSVSVRRFKKSGLTMEEVYGDPLLSEEERVIVAKTIAFGKGGIFHFWKELSEVQKRVLIDQLKEIDALDVRAHMGGLDLLGIEMLEEMHQKFIKREEPGMTVDARPDNLDIPQVFDLSSDEADPRAKKAVAIGSKLLREGKVAVLELAGGTGSRFGSKDPKIMLHVSQVMMKSLGRMRAELIRGISERFDRARIPWLIMTSDVTDVATREFLKTQLQGNEYFGQIQKDLIETRQQRVLPQMTAEGEFILETPNRVVVGGFGHGDMRDWILRDAGVFKWLDKNEIEYVVMANVDNALLPALSPKAIGYHVLASQDAKPGEERMSFINVEKAGPAEPVGVSVLLDGKNAVIEYNQFTPELLPYKYAYQFENGQRFVIERSDSGEFRLISFDSFIENIKASGLKGEKLELWIAGNSKKQIQGHLAGLDDLPEDFSADWFGTRYSKKGMKQSAALWLKLGSINALIWSVSSFKDREHPLPALPVVVAKNKEVAGYDPETFRNTILNKDGKGEAVKVKTNKFEIMAFHGFDKGTIHGAQMLAPREEAFAPIKEPKGKDSPESARQIFSQAHQKILREKLNWNVQPESVAELSGANREDSDLDERIGPNGYLGMGSQIHLGGRHTKIGRNLRVENQAILTLHVDREYDPKAEILIGDDVTVDSKVAFHLKGAGKVTVESGARLGYPVSFTLEDGEWLHIENGMIQRVETMLAEEGGDAAVFEMYRNYLSADQKDRAFVIRKLGESFLKNESDVSVLRANAQKLKGLIDVFEISRKGGRAEIRSSAHSRARDQFKKFDDIVPTGLRQSEGIGDLLSRIDLEIENHTTEALEDAQTIRGRLPASVPADSPVRAELATLIELLDRATGHPHLHDGTRPASFSSDIRSELRDGKMLDKELDVSGRQRTNLVLGEFQSALQTLKGLLNARTVSSGTDPRAAVSAAQLRALAREPFVLEYPQVFGRRLDETRRALQDFSRAVIADEFGLDTAKVRGNIQDLDRESLEWAGAEVAVANALDLDPRSLSKSSASETVEGMLEIVVEKALSRSENREVPETVEAVTKKVLDAGASTAVAGGLGIAQNTPQSFSPDLVQLMALYGAFAAQDWEGVAAANQVRKSPIVTIAEARTEVVKNFAPYLKALLTTAIAWPEAVQKIDENQVLNVPQGVDFATSDVHSALKQPVEARKLYAFANWLANLTSYDAKPKPRLFRNALFNEAAELLRTVENRSETRSQSEIAVLNFSVSPNQRGWMPGLVSILAGNQFLGVFVINPAESTQTGKKIIPIMLSDAVLSPFHANAAQFEVEVDGQGILRKVGDVRVNLTSNPKRDRKIEIKAKKATADRFAAVQHDLRTFLVAQIGKPWSAELFRQATTRSEIRQVALDRTLPVEARVQFVRNAFRPMGNWQRATGNEKALTSYVGRRALTAAPVDAEVPLTVGLPETAKNIRLQDTMTQSHQVIKAGDLVTGDGATRTSSETQTIYTEVKYDETVVEKVTRWFRAGILPLRVALTVIHEKSTALLARLDIHITNAEEAARAAENAVTLVTKPETLNPSKVKAARAVFGETITKASDAFILGAEFAFNRGAIAVMRTIFGDAPIAVLVRDQKDRDFIQKFNLQLAAANRQPILMADGVEEAQAFMRAETVRLQALGVTSVKIKGLVAASEPMAVALKEKIPDTMFVTDAMFGNFLSQAGIGIGRLVADIQAQFAFRKSA